MHAVKRRPQVTRIALIGAGSVVFTKTLLTDILSFPELRGSTIALHDIDPERLETAGMMRGDLRPAHGGPEPHGQGGAGGAAGPRLSRGDARPSRPERALPRRDSRDGGRTPRSPRRRPARWYPRLRRGMAQHVNPRSVFPAAAHPSFP